MRKSSLAVSAFGAVALLGAVTTIALDSRRTPAPRGAVPARLADLPLAGAAGPTTLAAGEGKWTVLLFGYLTCPDVCPTTLAYLARELRTLGPQAEGTRIVFVSVDPRRDTPAEVSKYAQHFDPRFVGLTGSATELEALTSVLGVTFGYEQADDSAAGYLVTHSSSLFVVDPLGRLVKAMSAPHERGVVSQELARLVGTGAH